jgi:hypothetical protein
MASSERDFAGIFRDYISTLFREQEKTKRGNTAVPD